MTGGWTKLHASIIESTIWLEPDKTRILWFVFLATKDRYGRVLGSVPGLAHKARIPLEDAEIAIKTFLSPDRYSRTKDHEGRRVEEIDGGWRVINHEKYRDERSEDDRKQQDREASQRYRDRQKAAGTKPAPRRRPSLKG